MARIDGMARIEGEIVIGRPVDVVFDYVPDQSNDPQYNPQMRPGEELTFGLVGKFWQPVIEYAHAPAERFRDFSEPGYAKTIYALSVRPLADGRSLLSGGSAPRPPTSTPAAGSAATGHSGSAPARISSSMRCWR